MTGSNQSNSQLFAVLLDIDYIDYRAKYGLRTDRNCKAWLWYVRNIEMGVDSKLRASPNQLPFVIVVVDHARFGSVEMKENEEEEDEFFFRSCVAHKD